MVAEVPAASRKLKAQIESAAAEKQQREAGKRALAEQVIDGRRSARLRRQRDQEIAGRVEQVRARLAELEEALKTARAELDAARDRRGELAAEQAPRCSPTRST